MSLCSDYYIDTASNKADAILNTSSHNAQYLSAWEDEKGLTGWLTKHKIGETVFEIVSIDTETQEINEEELP
jgi:hypothetical protein